MKEPIMPDNLPPQDDADDLLTMYEQLAAEFLTEQAEALYRDSGDQQLDQFSDAALADQLVLAGAGQKFRSEGRPARLAEVRTPRAIIRRVAPRL
jgi:hypothetical protein